VTERDELDKWAEHAKEYGAIGVFLDWAEKEGYITLEETPRLILNKYFGIDEKRLEQQRRALLNEHRKVTGQEP
jgi:zona occludens toxin (predicted ATPase)